jgi:hypothetical protein
MTTEERRDLHEDAAQLAYQAIKFSPLFGTLSNEKADRLAEEIALKLDAQLAELVGKALAEDTFGRIERSNAAQDAFSRR